MPGVKPMIPLVLDESMAMLVLSVKVMLLLVLGVKATVMPVLAIKVMPGC